MATPDSLSVNALFSVAGKIAVVTGGSRGIGEMIAAGLLANGAKVYISSRKADQCDATAARLSAEYGGECVSIPADLSTMEGITALASAI
ncbi:MAG: SDR family NAD(P)-dependent oxidoreductase, partial [Ilumatobacteraceae bacterium]